MSKSTIIPDDAKDHFWSVVRDCLVEFHRQPKPTSRAKVDQFRKKVEDYPKEAMELFYHSEPFDIACRIANNRIKVDEHIKRYLQIRDPDNCTESGK